MRFRSSNRIKYSQDRDYSLRGIPSGVDFAVTPIDETAWKLTACGYGCFQHDDCYGNGALYAWDLTNSQQRRFEVERAKRKAQVSQRLTGSTG